MSIQSEVERLSANVQSALDTIRQTGVSVPENATSDALPAAAASLANEKQDKLTGSQGQVVGFDAEGNAVAQAAPQTGMTQEQADQRYLQKTGGNASGNIGVTSGDSSLELQVNTSGDTLTLAFVNRVAGGAYIRNTENAEINIGTERGFRMSSRYKDLVLTGGNFVSATAPSDDDHLTNKAYVDSKTLALGETADTAGRGDWTKAAYDHSQITNANPHGTTAAQVGAAPSTHPSVVGNASTLGHVKPTTEFTVGADGALSLNTVDGGTFA